MDPFVENISLTLTKYSIEMFCVNCKVDLGFF